MPPSARSQRLQSLVPGKGVSRQEPLEIPEWWRRPSTPSTDRTACQGANDMFARIEASHFILPPHYLPYVDRVAIPRGLIQDRTEKLANDIYQFYKGRFVHVLCILKGSREFCHDLLTYMNKMHMYSGASPNSQPPYLEHYIRLRSYRGSEKTSQLEVIGEDLDMVTGENVLIVEDIIDTGETLRKFTSWLQDSLKPKSICIASLLERRRPDQEVFKGDFVGFSIPDGFVIGYGLDYHEYFRDLEHVCLMNQEGAEHFNQMYRNLYRHSPDPLARLNSSRHSPDPLARLNSSRPPSRQGSAPARSLPGSPGRTRRSESSREGSRKVTGEEGELSEVGQGKMSSRIHIGQCCEAGQGEVDGEGKSGGVVKKDEEEVKRKSGLKLVL
eukprot:GHVN01084353.1.p1 GENE.GHVN01084353.1~~GHVN01084353.1.p1  ORF type:complete len:392 (-),score=52.60 GHVN01084353.1:194-1348(-)